MGVVAVVVATLCVFAAACVVISSAVTAAVVGLDGGHAILQVPQGYEDFAALGRRGNAGGHDGSFLGTARGAYGLVEGFFKRQGNRGKPVFQLGGEKILVFGFEGTN